MELQIYIDHDCARDLKLEIIAPNSDTIEIFDYFALDCEKE